LTNTILAIPLLHHELVFNFCENYCISQIAGQSHLLKNKMSWISGIQTKSFIVDTSGKHEMIGVLFKPNGLKAFTKNPSSDFGEYFIDSSFVFDKSFENLLEQIQETAVASSKIFLIEKYLLNVLNPENSPNYLSTSLDLLSLRSDKRISVKDICTQISISNKSLIKTYQKHIGVTPIRYLQLLKINKAINQLTKHPRQSLTKLAYELNFYDQAHFIGLFKSTTSLTPSEYANKVMRNLIDKSSPNFITMKG
jgi:AraC-like DNA-binding protein